MASENTGIFASSLVEGFFGAKKDKEERDQKQKIIKLQAQLIEQQLAAGKVKIDAQTKLTDLFTGTIGEFEQVGEIAPTQGDRKAVPQLESTGRDPMSLSQMLSDPEGFSALIQSGSLNIKDLVGSPQQATSFTREAASAGILPGTPEFRDAFLAKNKADDAAAISAELLATIQLERGAKATSERKDKERERAQDKVRGRITVRNHFTLVNEAVEIMRDLKKTVLQSGLPGGDRLRDVTAVVGAVQEFFGKESPQAIEIVQKRDRLKKLLSVTLVDSIKAMDGVVSNARQQALLDALPTLENSDVANTQLFGDQMQSLLDEADISGFEVGGREFIEQFIADPLAGLRQAQESTSSFDGPAFIDDVTGKAQSAFDTAKNATGHAAAFATEQFNRAKPVVEDAVERARPVVNTAIEKAKAGTIKAIEVAQLTLNDIKQITPEDVKNWTAEQRAALEKRLDELGL